VKRAALRGRGDEVAFFGASLSEVQAGHGRVAVIQGEAGIGKSRLLAEIAVIARERGFVVAAGVGYELGDRHSYGAIAQAMDLRSSSPDPLRASIGDLLRRPPGESRQLEFRLLEDLLALTERISLERPALLIMDDAQWLDSASLLALAHLARHITSLRVGLIVALRPPPWRAQIDEFLGAVPTIEGWTVLEPLSRADVAELLTDLLHGRPGVRLLDQIDRAAGNPLFVRELVEALAQAGSLANVEGAVELSGPPLPASINRLVERRLRVMPAPTVRALRMASLLGFDFSLADLAEVMGQSAGAVADLVEPALQDGLLGPLGASLAFRHQLVRDAIYEQIPQSVRMALHRDIGRLLASRGNEVDRVATHLALGGPDARTEAVEWLRRAAHLSSATSPAQAVELLDRAIDLGGAGHVDRDEMQVDRVLALTWAGRAEEALGAARAMLRSDAAGPLAGRVRLGLARALLAQGMWGEAAHHLELLAGGGTADELERGRMIGDAAIARALSGDIERAVADARESLGIGERLRDDLTRSVAFSALAVIAHYEARHLDSVRASRRAVALAGRSSSPGAGPRPAALWLGLGLVDSDEFDEALTILQVGRRRSEEAGMVWHIPLYDDAIGTLHYHAGDWDDAVAEMETCIAMARQTGTHWWLATAYCMLAYIAIHRGQDDRAESAMATAAAFARPGSIGENRLRWVRALDHEARGELEPAANLLEEAWAATATAGHLPHHLIMGPDLVRVTLRLGLRERASQVARLTEEIADRTGVPSAVATGQRCRGLLDGDARALEDAVSTLRRGPRRAELAFASEEAGACHASTGALDHGVALLEQAIEGYEHLGARRDLDRVNARLHTLGVRRPRRRRPRRPALGWDALTESEDRVADLASRGLTNPEIGTRLFVSHRTVGTHLAHIYGKLQISSRVELARLAETHRRAGQMRQSMDGR
jgi:DNA-binding CsgD family transcriptional regulator/tetratricopeptide (TPR) repeat protein